MPVCKGLAAWEERAEEMVEEPMVMAAEAPGCWLAAEVLAMKAEAPVGWLAAEELAMPSDFGEEMDRGWLDCLVGRRS